MGLQAKIQTIIGKLILENATLVTQIEELQAELARVKASVVSTDDRLSSPQTTE
jgi:dynactin complex subunit